MGDRSYANDCRLCRLSSAIRQIDFNVVMKRRPCKIVPSFNAKTFPTVAHMVLVIKRINPNAIVYRYEDVEKLGRALKECMKDTKEKTLPPCSVL
jgi:hypothetical protein